MENYKLKKVYITMEKTIIKFGNIETEKQNFHQYKIFILTKKIKILMKQ